MLSLIEDLQKPKYTIEEFTKITLRVLEYLPNVYGIYYLDPPPNVFKEPFNKYMKPFSELITKDIWNLLTP